MDQRKKKYHLWNSRTSLEKFLVILLIAIILLCMGLTLKLFLPKRDYLQKKNVCMSEQCIRTASRILTNMNKKIDPCEDFYKFTCGNFLNTATIPEDANFYSVVSDMNKQFENGLRETVEQPVQDSDQKYLKLMKNFYKVCMNESKIEAEGYNLIRNALSEFGGWPTITNNWREDSFDWKQLLYKMRKLGFRNNFFIQLSVDTDNKNSSRRLLSISQSCMPLDRIKKGLNDTAEKAYFDFYINFAMNLGADYSRAQNDIEDIFDFRLQLAEIMVPREQRKNASLEYNLMSIRELQKEFPSISWLEFINSFLNSHDKLDGGDIVNVVLPNYLKNITTLLGKTRKRTLANYMIWLVLNELPAIYPEPLSKLHIYYLKIAFKTYIDYPRWQKCLKSLYSFRIGLSSFYVKRYFKSSSKRTVSELVDDIKVVFIDTMKKTGWMDKKTKRHALLKAEKMDTLIGYPDELLDDQKVDEAYRGLELNADGNMLQLLLNRSLFDHKYLVGTLKKPAEKESWQEKSYTYSVNAFYEVSDNSIELQAGILQDPFFDEDRPQYLNYGSMGYVIGHEITHGFDSTGRLYDKDGNLVDWWEPETNRTFTNKAQCLVEQYGNFSIPDTEFKINGELTLEENIADNGGIKNAYRGYLRWMDRNPVEPSLPGLPYNPQQMFWISAASVWCTKYKSGILEQYAKYGSHTPSYFRVIGPFMNSDMFAKDFSCPLGTFMNPKYKCRVW